jgi:hypothetical protein
MPAKTELVWSKNNRNRCNKCDDKCCESDVDFMLVMYYKSLQLQPQGTKFSELIY